MKKYIYSFTVCAALFCTSCDESRLDIEQKAVSSTETFYKTDQDAIDAMTAAYAQFLDNVCSSVGIYQPQFTLLNYSADDVFSAGTDHTDHMDMRIFDEFRYDTGSAGVKELYQRYYKAIYACNLVITYVDPAASTVMARCVAEARVLRAYCHMMAALTFQCPPKVDKLLGADDKPTNVESQKSLLEWCASECEEVVDALDARKGQDDVEGAYKVTKGFAYFVAGKSAVFAGDMARAVKNLKPLVESPNYALVPGNRFRDLFHVEGNGCEEKIFEANRFGNADKGFWSNIFRGGWMVNNVLNWRYDRLGSRASICGANDGWGGGAINWKFAEKMYENDGDGPRRKATFLTPDEFLYDSELCGWETDFDADGNEMSLADKKKDPKRGIKSTDGLFSHGIYMEVKNIESPNDRNMAISDVHNSASFRIARLGEAYLLYAEDCLETGNIPEGKKYLNAIQKRAEAPETELTIQTLRDEKQYELWFETCRFHDIVRWGIAKECQDAVVDQVPQLYDDFFIEGTPYFGKEHHLRAVLTHPLSVIQNLPANSYGFVKGKHEYFPFPKDVIDLNKELHQLNGWATK